MSVPAVCASAIDAIIAFEVTGKAEYNKIYSHPTWPGGASGVTIGIGFDLGYETRGDFDREWSDLPKYAHDQLVAVIGIKGDSAGKAVAEVEDVVIPWDAAVAAFRGFALPRYAAMTVKAFPGSDKIPEKCFGALVSLVYNRGTSMTGERRREMAAVRALIEAGRLGEVPALFRAMKRLWPEAKGLRDRREKEAALWDAGLTIGASA